MNQDTKDILDKDTLPASIYEYVQSSPFIPEYQWTFKEPITRIRFLAWSYSCDWTCGQIFGLLVMSWLKLFGFSDQMILWSDGGKERDE